MPARFRSALLLFRRDLRLPDNTALRAALARADRVIPAFIFDPRQADPDANPYFGAPAFRFLIESLDDLDRELRAVGSRLCTFHGLPTDVVTSLVTAGHVDAVFVNEDSTPFSRLRDADLLRTCAALGVPFESHPDALLHRAGSVVTDSGAPFRVFSAFHRRARRDGIPAPDDRPLPTERLAMPPALLPGEDPTLRDRLRPDPLPEPAAIGGRSNALPRLDAIAALGHYGDVRNHPATEGTTRLSPWLRFGCVSPREIARRILNAHGPDHALLSELHWRDFFHHVVWHEPELLEGRYFRREFETIRWRTDDDALRRWQEGTTGFPLVDAAMRELARSGLMHNRCRMVVASFLVKDLHLDWRLGERHFARCLLDYDPCVNNGNWQWAASTGCDAQPWFRIFNPWTQQRRFDEGAEYIRRWVPELRALDAERIHALREQPFDGYPRPMVDHAVASEAAKALFREATEAR